MREAMPSTAKRLAKGQPGAGESALGFVSPVVRDSREGENTEPNRRTRG
jgi:hypothetical protein